MSSPQEEELWGSFQWTCLRENKTYVLQHCVQLLKVKLWKVKGKMEESVNILENVVLRKFVERESRSDEKK
mgnify:FL=1